MLYLSSACPHWTVSYMRVAMYTCFTLCCDPGAKNSAWCIVDVWIIYCFITNCTHNVLAENDIYYFTVIVGKESGCSLSESSGSVPFTRLPPKCWLQLQPHLETRTGRMCFKLTWLLAGFTYCRREKGTRWQVSQVVGLRASVPHWLLARVCPQVLITWASPQGSSSHGSWVSKKEPERVWARRKLLSFVN